MVGKYVIFLIGLLGLVPIGAMVASLSRRVREVVFALLVFGTAFTDWYDINFVDRWWYAGSTRGLEVSVVDLLVLVLLFSTVVTMRSDGARLYWPASLGLMLVYFAYASCSVLVSEPKVFGMFEVAKLIRGMLVFLTVACYVRTQRDIYVLVIALSGVLIYNGVFAVMQRYLWHVYRANGTFPHCNVLGDYCILTGPVVLASALSPLRHSVKILCGVAWVCAAVATILTIARMPSLLFLASSACVLMTVYGFRLDVKRTTLIMALGILVCSIFYKGLDGLAERQEATSAADTEEGGRSGHYLVGWKMARDHPFGVGLNNWGWYFNQYQQWAGHEKLQPYASTREAGGGGAVQGHTLYGMTLGELGWPGLLIFLMLVSQWLFLSGSLLLTRSPDLWSRIGVGCFFGFVAEFIGNATEITFRNQHIFIIFNLLMGFVVAARYARAQEMKTNR